MSALETVAGIRNDHFRDKVPIKAIARKRRVFRNTVRKAVREGPEAFVRPCRRESLEMLVDAHNRAFAFFGGSCRRGIHDNMRAAVRKIRRGGERDWNERFLAMCGHHPVEPSACNPRLEAMCLEDAGRRRHPDTKGRSVLEAFEEERSSLAPFRGGAFESFRAVQTSATSTCLVPFDGNQCSVHAGAAGREVEILVRPDRIEIRRGGTMVAEHARSFAKGEAVHDILHYLPVLRRKPGAVRNGAPVKALDAELPAPWREDRPGDAGVRAGGRRGAQAPGAAGVRIDSARSEGGTGRSSEFAACLERFGLREGLFEAGELVALSDGAAWTRNVCEEVFAGMGTTLILDQLHAVEYAAAAMRALAPGRAGRKARMERIKVQLNGGRVDPAIADPEPHRHRDEAVEVCVRCMEANKDRMRCDACRKRGLPVGSGVVESACKRIVGSRFKRSGCRWSKAGANALPAAECRIDNSRWADFLDWRACRAAAA